MLSTCFLSQERIESRWETIEKSFIAYVKNDGAIRYHDKEYEKIRGQINGLYLARSSESQSVGFDEYVVLLFNRNSLTQSHDTRKYLVALHVDQCIALTATIIFFLALLGVLAGVAALPMLCTGTGLFNAYMVSLSLLTGLTMVSGIGCFYNEHKRRLLFKQVCGQILCN